MNPRIANAFRWPAALTEDDLATLVALWKSEASTAGRRRRAMQNTGGASETDTARNEAAKRRRAVKLAAE